MLVISVTGSAIVFRNELYNALWPGPRMVAISGPRLTHDQLRDAARRAYPELQGRVGFGTANRPIKLPTKPSKSGWTAAATRRSGCSIRTLAWIWANRGHTRIQFLAWLADLHINLLSGDNGPAC